MKFWLNHFNLNVINLNKSLFFYEKNLNLTEVRRKKAIDGKYEIVWISDEKKLITLELTWLRDQKNPYNLGDNEIHVALVTDDYQEAYKLHKKNEVICYENKNMGIYFISDPDGYWIEIIPQK